MNPLSAKQQKMLLWLLQRLTVLGLLVALTFSAGLFSYSTVRGLVLSGPGGTGAGGPSIRWGQGQGTPANTTGPGTPSATAGEQGLPVEAIQLTPWDGSGRVTVLLLGLDYRDWDPQEVGRPSRSDTMILLTLDPVTMNAGILSIPRDMWVAIPGFKHGKINTAYYLGDAYKMPGGGPALAVKTVEEFLGIEVNYYAQVDFSAFVRFIDEIGGVKVDVPEKITVDLLGAGEGTQTKKTLQPGMQTLPGEWALAYARARYTDGGDFDRAGRQQQVIMGIRDRILSLDMLPRLVAKAPALYAELSSGIRTNLSLDDAIKLAVLAREVPEENIRRGVLDQKTVQFGRSPDGLAILIPIPDKIHRLRDEIFGTGSTLNPLTPGDAKAQMQAEQARVAIYNGSDAAGLGARTEQYLAGLGVNVTGVGDADKPYTTTTIVDHTGSPFTVKYLVELMNINQYRVIFEFNPSSSMDVEVFLGNDWKVNNEMP